MYIEILSYIQHKEQRIRDLQEIFLVNANPKNVDTDEKRKSLYEKYAAPYISHWPDDVFFACSLQSQKTLGYLIGCRNSKQASSVLEPLIGSYSIFADMFDRYPAHLHMNVHPSAHGAGVGTFLIKEYLIELRKAGIKGAHIVTSPDLKNVEFYKKHKFTFTVERPYKNSKLLFMGLRF